jgi:SAM-dependent methyltransferase
MTLNSRISTFGQLYQWDLTTLSENQALKEAEFGVNASSQRTRYSVRALRYWIADQLMRRESETQGRSLKIAEIGVDRGQMLLFTKGVPDQKKAPLFHQWDALSLRIDESRLKKVGYSRLIQMNIEEDKEGIDSDYDVVIVLHILEHLYDPESALIRIRKLLRPGGIIIGGFPGIPRYLRRWREKHLRTKAAPWGHVSSFSSGRVKSMAKNTNLNLDHITGTFFFRASGSWMENHAAWIRLNLLFGACLPSYGGELYWVMRKPSAIGENTPGTQPALSASAEHQDGDPTGANHRSSREWP